MTTRTEARKQQAAPALDLLLFVSVSDIGKRKRAVEATRL
jgi:hypothetical protein